MRKEILYVGTISSKIAFPILNTLSSVMLGICNNFIDIFDKQEEEKYGKHAFIHFFIMFTAESLSIFIYLLQQKVSERKTISAVKTYKKEDEKSS